MVREVETLDAFMALTVLFTIKKTAANDTTSGNIKAMRNTLPKPIHCVELLNHNKPTACFHVFSPRRRGLRTLISSERVRKVADLVNMYLAAAVEIDRHWKQTADDKGANRDSWLGLRVRLV